MHLGDLFYEIRFRSMTIKEFFTLESKYHSVLSNDSLTIAKMIALPSSESGKFNKSSLQIKWNKHAIIECDRDANSRFKEIVYFRTVEETTFSTNKPIILGSIKCAALEYQLLNYESRSAMRVHVKISESRQRVDAMSKVLLKMRVSLYFDASTVHLSYPILIKPGFFYTISIGEFLESDCYHADNLKRKVKVDSDVIIKFHNIFPEPEGIYRFISSINFDRI